MLQAMNTGHDGSMTSLHANTAQDAFSRLETMTMMGAQGVPDRVIRQMITAAVHIVIQMTRLHDGARKVTNISEVRGTEGDRIAIDEIFVFDRKGQSEAGKSLGTFRATGHKPKVMERLKAYGVHIESSVFEEVLEIN